LEKIIRRDVNNSNGTKSALAHAVQRMRSLPKEEEEEEKKALYSSSIRIRKPEQKQMLHILHIVRVTRERGKESEGSDGVMREQGQEQGTERVAMA
jgi:hypothetical protein